MLQISRIMPTRKGSVHLFRFAGVNVFLHWSWFLVALFEMNNRRSQYSSVSWNVLEYLSLFLIVLLHEFGHALACRQVGGKADQLCSGRSAEWRMSPRRRDRGPHFGASPRARWSMSRSFPSWESFG